MIWITGCNGMLGKELSIAFKNKNIPFIETDREVDITDIKTIIDFTKNKNINWIINCAAYTQVDKAEDDVKNCKRINTDGASNIAICANKINASLIHISTDYVFNGKSVSPYKEEDSTNPIGVYGVTKRNGELKVLENNPKSYIIRTAWLYGKHGNNFVHTMLNLMQQKKEIKVVNDQHGTPTCAYDLSNVIIKIIKYGTNIPAGIYHYTNEGETTWFCFSNEIFKLGYELNLINNDCKIIPCTSEEFPCKVKRPKYSVLNKSKIKKILNINIPYWENSLKDYLIRCAS